MSHQWIGKEQVLEITGWSASWLKIKVRNGEVATRETDVRGRNGKPVKEYSVASLPADARAKLAGEDTPTPKTECGTAKALAPLFASLAPAATTRVALIDPHDKEKAAKRLAVIQPLLDYRAAAPGSVERTKYLQCVTRKGCTVSSVEMLAQYLSEVHGISARTILRWTSAYVKKGGDVALADKRRADKGQSRWANKYPELAILAAHKVLIEDASTKAICHALRRRANELGIKPPCRESIRLFRETGISESMKTMAQGGMRKYEETFMPWMKRGYEDVAANELWVSDHMISDVLCQNNIFPPFDLSQIRIHITTMLDFRSRYPVATTFSENGSSRSILAALVQGIVAYGRPRGAYFDNGKDFDKIAEGARPVDVERALRDASDRKAAGIDAALYDGGVLKRIGVEVTNCLPYHPQSKHIERFHNNAHQHVDKLFMNAYTGIAPHMRPDATSAALGRHKGLLMMQKKGVMDAASVASESDLPLASDYIRDYLTWLELDYKLTPHRGQGMYGLSPAAVFERYRWKDERPPLTPEQMALLLPDREVRTVDAAMITLRGRRYLWASGDERAKCIMHELTTQKVVVLYNPCDLDQVVILDESGHYLCRLEVEVLMRQSSDKENRERISNFSRERNGLKRGVIDSIDAISQHVLQSGYQTPLEDLRERGRLLSTGTDPIVQRPQRPDLRPSRSAQAPASSADIANNFLEAIR